MCYQRLCSRRRCSFSSLRRTLSISCSSRRPIHSPVEIIFAESASRPEISSRALSICLRISPFGSQNLPCGLLEIAESKSVRRAVIADAISLAPCAGFPAALRLFSFSAVILLISSSKATSAPLRFSWLSVSLVKSKEIPRSATRVIILFCATFG